MKKALLIFALMISFFGSAQYAPSTNVNYIKYLKTPPVSDDFSDSLLLYRNSDKFQYMMPVSLLGRKLVPLAGTLSGYPITSVVESKSIFNFTNDSGDLLGYFGNDGGSPILQLQSSDGNTYFKAYQDGAEFKQPSRGSIYLRPKTGEDVLEISISGASTSKRGISGSEDYSGNVQDLDYVQKKYVDSAIVANPVPTLQQVTNAGNTTDNPVVIQSGFGSQTEFSGTSIFLSDFGGVTTSELGQDFIDFKKDGVRKRIYPGTITQDNQFFSLPDKPTGSYVLATTDDIPASTGTNLTYVQNSTGLFINSSTQTVAMPVLPEAVSTPAPRAGIMPAADKVAIDDAKAQNGILKSNGSGDFGTVVSGTDIKTINGTSLLGSGNITTGNVTGPTTTTDNTITRFDGTSGNLQGSTASITDNGELILAGVSNPTYAAGKLAYDTDNQSLTFTNDDSSVSLQVGQEEWIRVRNTTGSTIANGAAVYFNGSSSGLPTIALAQANSGTTTVCAGITTEAIPNNAVGYVTSLGIVRGLNTSGFSVGAVYLSATTPGALTQTAPTSPNYRYRVGFVTTVNASTGTIHVTPSTAALGNGTAGQLPRIGSTGAQEYFTPSYPRVIASSGDTYSGTDITGEQIVYSAAIPANTLVDDSTLSLTMMFTRLAANGNVSFRVYLNDTNDLVTPLQIAFKTMTMANYSDAIERTFGLKSNVIKGFNATTSITSDKATSTAAPTLTSISTSTTYYLIITMNQLATGNGTGVYGINLTSSK
jgi:hypothetical protein